ncbi:hypothetical protein F4680DRAFT_470632 [Xylaria scruposa]|nr:hypothetical protein F4680DRAFT_470632 [Xylaria scruposa]
MVHRNHPSLSAGLVAALSGLFLSGAMMNISILDVPVLLKSTENSLQLINHWSQLYEVGSSLYPTVAITIGLLYGLAAAARLVSSPIQNRVMFVLAGTLTLAMAPFTWVFMSPTNNALFRIAELGQTGVITPAEDVRALLVKWRWLHFVRSLFPLVGAMLGFREAKLQ